MKNLSFLLLTLLIINSAQAQGCLPSGITFSSQIQIDNFQSNYPGCTKIEGSATISGGDIVNLSGLNVLTAVDGVLSIGYNPVLTSLAGLEMLGTVGSSLIIGNNADLESLSALESLSFVGYDFKIGNNPNLLSIATGGQLGQVYANLEIVGNEKLASLNGFESLQHVGGALLISNNLMLSSLSGLDYIDGNSILSLYVVANPNLSTCEVESVCEYLAVPDASVSIDNNAPGCNSVEEVEEACFTSNHEFISESGMKIIPNPSSDNIAVFIRQMEGNGKLEIFNLAGEKLLEKQINTKETNLNISTLLPGVYVVRVQDEKKIETRPFIKQ